VTLADGDVVLLKDQSSAADNGLYIVGALPVRHPDYRDYDAHAGLLVTVEEGSANADTVWLGTSNRGGTLDTTTIAFALMVPAAGAEPAFPSGTRMLFQQTAAPTGWTKETTHNDKVLRVVSGTVGSGGSVAFSTVFGKTATDAHTLTISQIPSHDHDYTFRSVTSTTAFAGSGATQTWRGQLTTQTGNQGGGGSHAHTMDIRVHYVDAIIASKD
jgi:hypothetical protein